MSVRLARNRRSRWPERAFSLAGIRSNKDMPKPVDPLVKQLAAENRRLHRKPQRAETITLQKEVAEIL